MRPKRSEVMLAGILLLLGSEALASSPKPDPAVEAIAAALFETLDAEVVADCPEEPRVRLTFAVRHCGRLPRGTADEREVVERVDRIFREAGAEPIATEKAGRVRDYRVRDLAVRFFLASNGRRFLLRYPPRFAGCLPQEIPAAGSVGLTPPVLLHRVEARFPKPVLAAPPGAIVVLHAVIRADGTIGEVCVIHATPAKLDFTGAAIDAVKQWLYAPTMRGDQPIDSAIGVTVEFTRSGAGVSAPLWPTAHPR